MSSVVGFFNHYDEAEKAVKALEDEGIDSGRIGLIPQDADPTKEVNDHPILGKMQSVTGRYLVSVKTNSSEESRVIRDILSNAGAAHMETRGDKGAPDVTGGLYKGQE